MLEAATDFRIEWYHRGCGDTLICESGFLICEVFWIVWFIFYMLLFILCFFLGDIRNVIIIILSADCIFHESLIEILFKWLEIICQTVQNSVLRYSGIYLIIRWNLLILIEDESLVIRLRLMFYEEITVISLAISNWILLIIIWEFQTIWLLKPITSIIVDSSGLLVVWKVVILGVSSRVKMNRLHRSFLFESRYLILLLAALTGLLN